MGCPFHVDYAVILPDSAPLSPLEGVKGVSASTDPLCLAHSAAPVASERQRDECYSGAHGLALSPDGGTFNGAFKPRVEPFYGNPALMVVHIPESERS